MRRAPLLAAAALVLGGAVVLIGGRMVANPVAAVAPVPQPPTIVAAPAAPAPCAPALPRPPQTSSRLVAPKIVAPPEIDPSQLQREPPREPLSELGLAPPPEPEVFVEWAGTPFYRPVAVESAIFESMGHKVAIAGTQSVALNETCLADGISWRCGVRARTAFRLWLRGRALVCALPDETDAAVVDCPLPAGQAGCRRMAGFQRLGAGGARWSLCEGRGDGASGEDGHIRPAARHVRPLGGSGARSVGAAGPISRCSSSKTLFPSPNPPRNLSSNFRPRRRPLRAALY